MDGRPLSLSFTYTGAFYALRDCTCVVAERHGEEFALEWANRVLDADIELFVRIEIDSRPRLRLVHGGSSPNTDETLYVDLGGV